MKTSARDEPVVMFLKFTSEEKYAHDILNGKFYSNDANCFRNLEKISGEHGQGDINELVYNMPYVSVQIFDPKNMKMIMGSNKASAKVVHKNDGEIPFVCFVGIRESDLIKCNDGGKEGFRFPFTNEELSTMETKFGKYCVIITPEALIKRLLELQNKYNIMFEPIKYVNSADLSKALSHFNGKIDRFFYKDDDFAYQREYRLCIFDKMPKDHYFYVSQFNSNEAFGIESKYLKNARFYFGESK